MDKKRLDTLQQVRYRKRARAANKSEAQGVIDIWWKWQVWSVVLIGVVIAGYFISGLFIKKKGEAYYDAESRRYRTR
ncbi:MAG TPA: hypothetical protein VEJ63_06780 [Planctomycetota bacterium]|nr:hypothetical protein [Planctomycetota bacterium]